MRALSLFASLWALVAGTANGFAAAPETAALQAEIDRLAAAGGGTLIVTAGVHRTGALFFKPGVNLHLNLVGDSPRLVGDSPDLAELSAR